MQRCCYDLHHHACMSIPRVMLASHSMLLAQSCSNMVVGGGGGVQEGQKGLVACKKGEDLLDVKSGGVVVEIMQMRRSVK